MSLGRTRGMTPERRRVLDFIDGFDRRAGRGPTYTEMEQGLDLPRSPLFVHVKALVAAGLLAQHPQTRKVVVVRDRAADPVELRECLARAASCLRAGDSREPEVKSCLAWADRLLGGAGAADV